MLKVREITCKTLLLILFITTFTAATTFAEKATILTGQDYFQTVHQAIEEAKESIYVAMYLINVEPSPTDNPASILLESLINAKKRGVSVKIILDDSKFNINYNAYKRLKEAGIDVNLDSSQTVLHGKGIVIDSQICILGSFNWSRASLYDNYEFATYIEDQQQAKTLLDYLNHIEISPEIPILTPQYQGLKLPASLLLATPKSPLSELFTSHSEKAFDLYLYLLKKAQNQRPEGHGLASDSQNQNTNTLKINYQELGKALGYTKNYYFNLFQPLNKLKQRYRLIQHKPWSKYLTLKPITSPEYIIIPDDYWNYGLNRELSFAAKYMFLISLAEAQKSNRNPYWFRSNEGLSQIYHIAERSITNGITELEKENILEVYRHKPEELGEFQDRPANNYRLNPLQSQEQFQQILEVLSRKYGADITQKACKLSDQLNEPKDLQKIETYIELIQTYGYERVEEVNSKVSSKRRETGFHDISQTILLLKGLSPKGTVPAPKETAPERK